MGISIINIDNKRVLACKIPSYCVQNYKGKKGNNNIGNKIEDFTILQVMGKGTFGFVAKVKSKINHEIYALKKIIIENLNEEQRKQMKNEIIFLKYFDHNNVCSCLTSFEKDGCFYFVMKLFNNKDLHKFLLAYINLNINIKEDVLWDIFYQCLDGLTYIHNKGIIHRDIKLANILIDDKKKIIIGDFGISAVMDKNSALQFIKEEEDKDMIDSLIFNPNTFLGTKNFKAPEVENHQMYNQKADVYSMGVCFYSLCFWGVPYNNLGNMFKLRSDIYYSNELKDIIERMVEIDQNKRPTSYEIFGIFKKHYMKKYMKNSSIYSVVRCLFGFPNFSAYFSDQRKIWALLNSKYEKKIALIMIQINSSLNDKTCNEGNIFDLRRKLNEEGIKEKDNKEILPSSIINIILNSLNYELNELPPLEGINYINFIHDNFKPEDANQKYVEFIDYYKRNFKSIIAKDFFGVLKNTRTCNICNLSLSSYEKFHYINFNLTVFGNILGNTPISIYNIIDYMKKTYITLDSSNYIFCQVCKTYTIHTEKKNLYDFRKNLIFVFNRGINNQSKVKIDFAEKAKFKQKFVENISDREYTLIGVISESNNKYISFVKNNKNEWFCYNIYGDPNGKIIPDFDDIKNYGNVMALFYYDYGLKKLFDNNDINEKNDMNKNTVILEMIPIKMIF